MEYVKITISLPIDLKKKLERISQKEIRSQSNMIAALIDQYSEKE